MVRPLACLLLAVPLLLPAPPAAADYAKGIAAYGQADYATALHEFSAGAANGDPQSQYMLGTLYEMGLGVKQDFVEAWVWQSKAARAGIPEAIDARNTLEGVMTPPQRAEAAAAEAMTPPVATAELPPAPPTDTTTPSETSRPIQLVPRTGTVVVPGGE